MSGVFAVTKISIQQQQYIGTRASSFCLCAGSHGVYVWLVHWCHQKKRRKEKERELSALINLNL